MNRARRQTVIAGLAAFDAVTAIGGGVAMLVGADSFPAAWLRGTPFSSYTVPALSLTIVVGGSSLVAAVTTVTSPTVGVRAALVAGCLMAVYQIAEIILLDDAVLISWIEALYLALGLTITGLAAQLWLVRERRHPRRMRHAPPI